jgi:NADH dehydrogenase
MIRPAQPANALPYHGKFSLSRAAATRVGVSALLAPLAPSYAPTMASEAVDVGDGMADAHHVVVVGAGFGGLEAVHRLAGAPVRITIVDRRNHHLFQPLLYQAATASLAPSEIAWPIRHLFRRRPDVTTLLASVESIDKEARELHLDDGSTLRYDTLVLATGARHAYFGHDDWEPFAPGLKTLEDATTIRGRILLAFEEAERESDEQKRAALMTFAIVGAGPTGVELAGTIAELARSTLPADFRHIDTRKARIVLIEAGPRVLPAFAEDLSTYAKDSLERLGVEVVLGQAVSGCSAEGVVFGNTRLAAATIIWAAGVQSSPAAQWLEAPADKAGRLKVEPDLSVPEHPEIFAIGDAAIVLRPDGRPVPGIAPAAKQEGAYVANVIRARLRGGAPAPPPFRYKHAGDLATIGKRRAAIDFGWIKLKGAIAWWLWGFAHIYFLIGVRNRLSVALNWLWIYARDQRSARLITWWGGEVEGTAPFPREERTEGAKGRRE